MQKNRNKEKLLNIVSLGWFCGISQEMERKGLRSISLPFDWLITKDFRKILELIETDFVGFINQKSLIQEDISPNYYYDSSTGFRFFHDFNDKEPLNVQYDSVLIKYQRRIKRFYQIIQEPTLFIRYCYNSDEMEWINENIENIKSILTKYNSKNRIIFIYSNPNYTPKFNDCFYIEVSPGDEVSRHCFFPNILNFIYDNVIIDSSKMKKNILRYNYIQWKRKINIRVKKILSLTGLKKEKGYASNIHNYRISTEILNTTNPYKLE